MQSLKNISKIEFSHIAKIIPRLTPDRYKGQNGKIAVVGGSFDYTGAPYYAGISALKGGGDLSHIFCTETAGIPIKCYSPELIVHNSLVSSDICKESEFDQKRREKCVTDITKWFDSMHSVVFGPGLGRDPLVGEYLEDLLSKIHETSTVVFDGDMLWYLSDSPVRARISKELKSLASRTTLTPNKVEFDRLWKSVLPDKKRVGDAEKEKAKTQLKNYEATVLEVDVDNPYVSDVVNLSRALHNVAVSYKGEFDVISDGQKVYVVKEQGGLKRSGGQGDILSGLMGLYTHWNSVFCENEKPSEKESRILKGCILANIITKRAAYAAFQKHKYGLTTPLIIEHLPDAIDAFASVNHI